MRRPRVTVLYHYFHPDDVVSARHYEDLCKGLVARGWEVEAMPCNRGCRDEGRAYPRREVWQGIAIRRIWRPRLRQASTLGRLANAAWLIVAWSLLLVMRRGRDLPDVLLIGTDPILSVVVAWVVKRLRPRVRVVHWCFDLYPEAAIAEGILGERSFVTRLLKRLTGAAYRSCDLVADLGRCMGQQLARYQFPARQVTLVPWALSEPEQACCPDPVARRQLFGEASLGLLYSGNFGRAHSSEEFLELARRLRREPIHVCFGVRGNQADSLRAAVRADDVNVSFTGFAPEEVLAQRLSAADIHLVSLRSCWTGVVVPSKFFGSLAAGRPVLFAGSEDAAIARWIQEHQVGWVLSRETLPQVAQELRRLAGARDELLALQRRCRQVYHAHFSQTQTLDRWNQELRALLAAPARAAGRLPVASTSGPALPTIGLASVAELQSAGA
jgi:glycosyltransferase involved in cell wall biosynthesis